LLADSHRSLTHLSGPSFGDTPPASFCSKFYLARPDTPLAPHASPRPPIPPCICLIFWALVQPPPLFFSFLFPDVTPLDLRCTSGGGSSADAKTQVTTQDSSRGLGCGVVLKSSVTGSSALAWRTTHLTWFPIKHAQPAETHSPGATWRRSVPFWGYPDLALAYFTLSLVDHFGKPGWHAAVCAAARPRPAIGMERAATCGGAEEPSPCPHTVTHFSRISIGISFLLSIETTPNLSFRGFSSRLCHPRQPGLAPGGLGQFIHTLTLALAHRLSAGFAPPSKQSLLPRQQFASTFEDATFLQPPGRTLSNANRAG